MQETGRIEDLLTVAPNIRALIDEILLRISYLPEEDKAPESPHLLALFDLFTGVIEEEIVIEAAVFADKGAVVLHTSTPPNAQNDPEPINIPQTEEEILAIQRIEEIRGLEGSIEELFGLAEEQDEPELDQHGETQQTQPSVRITKPSSSQDNLSVDIFDDIEPETPLDVTISDQNTVGPSQLLSSLNSIQDKLIVDCSLDVTTTNPNDISMPSGCTEAELPPQKVEKGLRFYEIVRHNSEEHIYLFPHVNYCGCAFYRKNVIEERKDFTCCHVLATWLSEALGTTKIVHSPPDTLKTMSQFFIDRADNSY